MEEKKEILEQVWLGLVDKKAVLQLCEKGLEMDINLQATEMNGVIRIVEQLLEDLIQKLDAMIE